MRLSSVRAQLLFSTALVGITFISCNLIGPVRAQAIIDGGERATVPGNRPDPWIITPDGILTIGSIGLGELTIRTAGSVTAERSTFLGFAARSEGILTVDGAGSSLDTGNLIVGTSGSGELTIQNGGVVHADDRSSVGNFRGSQGTVTVKGVASSLLLDARIWIGRISTGTLTIEDGGRVANIFGGTVGHFPGSSASATVTGAGTTPNFSPSATQKAGMAI